MTWKDWTISGLWMAGRTSVSVLIPGGALIVSSYDTIKSIYHGNYGAAAMNLPFTLLDAYTMGMGTQAIKDSAKQAVVKIGKNRAEVAGKEAVKSTLKAGPTEAAKDTFKRKAWRAVKKIHKEQGEENAIEIAKYGLKGADKDAFVHERKLYIAKLTKEETKKIGNEIGKEIVKDAKKAAKKKVGNDLGAFLGNRLQQTTDEVLKKGYQLTATSVAEEAVMGALRLTGVGNAVFEHLVRKTTENLIQKALPKATNIVFDTQLQMAATKAAAEEFAKLRWRNLYSQIARNSLTGALNLYNGEGKVL